MLTRERIGPAGALDAGPEMGTRIVGSDGDGTWAPGPSILEPGRNVWRVARAGRAAVLQHAAAYYGALRRAMLNARRSIIIVGWDIDSRTPQVGEAGRPEDGLPATLAAFSRPWSSAGRGSRSGCCCGTTPSSTPSSAN